MEINKGEIKSRKGSDRSFFIPLFFLGICFLAKKLYLLGLLEALALGLIPFFYKSLILLLALASFPLVTRLFFILLRKIPYRSLKNLDPLIEFHHNIYRSQEESKEKFLEKFYTFLWGKEQGQEYFEKYMEDLPPHAENILVKAKKIIKYENLLKHLPLIGLVYLFPFYLISRAFTFRWELPVSLDLGVVFSQLQEYVCANTEKLNLLFLTPAILALIYPLGIKLRGKMLKVRYHVEQRRFWLHLKFLTLKDYESVFSLLRKNSAHYLNEEWREELYSKHKDISYVYLAIQNLLYRYKKRLPLIKIQLYFFYAEALLNSGVLHYSLRTIPFLLLATLWLNLGQCWKFSWDQKMEEKISKLLYGSIEPQEMDDLWVLLSYLKSPLRKEILKLLEN